MVSFINNILLQSKDILQSAPAIYLPQSVNNNKLACIYLYILIIVFIKSYLLQ